MDELIQMTGSKDFVFRNLNNSTESVKDFVETFKKLSVGEKCEFSRGGEGAAIKCNPESMTVTVTTKNRFFGHFYVQNQFRNQDCRWRPLLPLRLADIKDNETMAGEQEISFTIALDKCDLEQQFSVRF